MTWPEIEAKMKETRLVVVPVGSVEQHGLHLGVGADWMQSWEMSRRVGDKTGYPVLPILPYGVSGHHKEFPGVITLSFQTYQKVVEEVPVEAAEKVEEKAKEEQEKETGPENKACTYPPTEEGKKECN